jgi:wobble nucleotide-excising tRNase
MNSTDALRSEIVRLEKLLLEKDEALKKMSEEISALVKFILSKSRSVSVIPNFTVDGQDVPQSKI